MKLKWKRTWVAFLFVGAVGVAGANDTLPSPDVETLPNGLQVAWFADAKLPIVDIALLVKSGTRDDPMGKSGVAELTSDLLERGSAGLVAKEMSRRVEALGGSAYSEAEEDATSLGVHGLSSDANALLEILAQMALHPNFAPTEFDRAQQLMMEYWQHLGDSAEGLADFVFTRTILNQSSYARGSVQSPGELRRIRLADVQTFYRAHFTPKNSILAVVGRVDREAFRKILLDRFGAWTGDAPVRKYRKIRDPRFGEKQATIYVVDRKDLNQAQIRVGFPIVGIQSPKRYALAVANALTGEYFGSRLNSVIRDELGLAYGVSSSLNYGRDKAYLAIQSATQAENSGRLVLEVMNILSSIKRGGISEAEVTTAREYLVGSFPMTVSTLGAVATRWLSGVVYDLGPDFLNEYLSRVRAVTHPEVVAAVDESYRLRERVIVIAGDAKKITSSLIASGFKDMKTIDAKKFSSVPRR